MKRSEPVRTWVGCSGRDLQGALRRFVASADRLVVDGAHRAPGRGAYLHPRPECWSAFTRRRGSVRSLRATPSVAEREGLVARLAAAEAQR